MTMTSAMPKARERKSRTRTKHVSQLPAIRLTRLLPSHIDLMEPLTAAIVCVDCKTWCPITGMLGRVQKLVPHHTGKAGEAAAIRCRSSNRRVEFDMTIPEWRQALTDATTEASSRTTTTVLPKAFSPQTDRTLRARAERTPASRMADWKAVQVQVNDTDAARKELPDGARPADGPQLPLKPEHLERHDRRQAELGRHARNGRPAEEAPVQLECANCGTTELDVVRAAAAGWRQVLRRTYCGRCAGRFPAWMRTQL
ncbi:hypothetical protein GCM10010371_65900 [Streptomyces subrutilus]|uniref:Uncharacterized protein n=1 Tax=Streptomyces subrutilus TaxID=36818 RepID=A0A918RGI0_9ACTN|nr:hypothetical protein [Streptomyces subrutilus]GGZ96795.1 hypothetical protein GCM10010371_65900 [Streptomyces subrutilus]